MVPMHFLVLFVCLLLLPLSLSQPLPSAVFCDKDGLCLTENGNQAVCGFLGTPEILDLPRAEFDRDGYKIRVIFSEILQEPENTEEPVLQEQVPPEPATKEPQPEEPACNPDPKMCRNSPQGSVISCEPSTAAPEGEPISTPETETNRDPSLQSSVVDPDNPFLGGAECVTRAFRRRCRLCCSSTAFRKSREFFRGSRRESLRAQPQADLQANVCQTDICGGAEAFSALNARRRSSNENCFQREPLGFFRSPNRAFFRVCDRSGICNPRIGCER